MLCFEIPTDGVMSPGVVVSGVLLTGHHLLGVEQLAVGAGPDLINDGWLKVQEDSPRHVLAGPSLGEESGEAVVSGAGGLVAGKLPI